MLTKNDPSGRWVNGTIGFVDKLEKDKIFVKVGKRSFQVEKFYGKNTIIILKTVSLNQK